MNYNDINSLALPRTGLTGLFHKTGNVFYVNSPCVFTEKRNLEMGQVYELLDLLEDVRFNLRRIKLMSVYLKGFTFYICGIDIDTGDMIKRSHRLDSKELPCDWLIIDILFFATSEEKRAMKTYCEKSSTNIPNTMSNDDLLELEY